jgi:hypothetical protein
MHHKRKGPKSTRAGCLLCKPHKRQGARHVQRQRHSINRRIAAARQSIERTDDSGADGVGG